MKHILLLFFAVCSSIFSASAYDFEYNGLYFNIVSSNDLTCEVCGHSDYYTESGNLNIPATIENGETYTVIGVADYSFEGNESYTFNDIDGYWNLDISSISFPSTIQYIGKYAFDSCKKLRGINLPESVVEIGEGAFRN